MDLTRPVTYRDFDLNDASVGDGGRISGCQIDDVDFAGIDSVGYREKRSLSDGLDASDVFLGGRYVHLKGTLYGVSRAELFDLLADLRACFLPTAAYAESPSSYGYMPLAFEDPTEDTVTWTEGFITKQIYVRPFTTVHFTINRDHVGGSADMGFSIPWDVVLEARDPRIYYQSLRTTYFDAAGSTSSGSGSVTNRGPYPAPLNILIYVPAGQADRVVELTAFGSVTKITVPNSANARIARYNGEEKYLTLEELSVETLRMDLLEFTGALDHPLVPSGPQSYSWTCKTIAGANANIHADSRFWFAEAWI